MNETITLDDEVWKVSEMNDGLPIFMNENGFKCAPSFDKYEDITYWALLIETENENWMDTYEEDINAKKRCCYWEDEKTQQTIDEYNQIMSDSLRTALLM